MVAQENNLKKMLKAAEKVLSKEQFEAIKEKLNKKSRLTKTSEDQLKVAILTACAFIDVVKETLESSPMQLSESLQKLDKLTEGFEKVIFYMDLKTEKEKKNDKR